MNWKDVGDWLQNNAGTGAALVGSLLTGNIPAAVGLGVKLVAGATGTANPDAALQAFQNDPATVVKLKELAIQSDSDIRDHIEKMAELEMQDNQKEQLHLQSAFQCIPNQHEENNKKHLDHCQELKEKEDSYSLFRFEQEV